MNWLDFLWKLNGNLALSPKHITGATNLVFPAAAMLEEINVTNRRSIHRQLVKLLGIWRDDASAQRYNVLVAFI